MPDAVLGFDIPWPSAHTPSSPLWPLLWNISCSIVESRLRTSAQCTWEDGVSPLLEVCICDGRCTAGPVDCNSRSTTRHSGFSGTEALLPDAEAILVASIVLGWLAGNAGWAGSGGIGMAQISSMVTGSGGGDGGVWNNQSYVAGGMAGAGGMGCTEFSVTGCGGCWTLEAL